MAFISTCTIIVLSSVITTILGEDNVCIWNVIDTGLTNEYTFVNGLYEYTEEYNSRPMYINNDTGSCNADALYLYWDTYWYIGATKPETDSEAITGLVGKCEAATADTPLMFNPSLCVSRNGEWEIPYNSDLNTSDPKIEATLGSCAAWNNDCTKLSITVDPADSEECNGVFTFDASFGVDNVFSRTMDESTTMYWYFNWHGFQWVCSDIVDLDTCRPESISYSQLSFASDYWTDLDVDGTTTFTLQSDASLRVQCTETAKPTSSPTKGPLPAGDEGDEDGVGGSCNIVNVIGLNVVVMFGMWITNTV